MASLDDLLTLIPTGSQYDALRWTLQRINSTFPDEMPEISTSRLAGWIKEIDSGTARDADDIRDDIFKYVVGTQTIMSVLGVDEATANKLIVGGNDGGLNFSDLNITSSGDTTATGNNNALPPTTTAPSSEDQQNFGEGTQITDPDNPIPSILTSKERKYYYDSTNGLWYISYGLPNSNRTVVFEASPDQMDQIYGEGRRPAGYTALTDINTLLSQQGVTFGGDIVEMAGVGTFESLYAEAIAKAMDDGVLPSWMEGNDAAMDILFVAHTEQKSQDWVVEQLSSLPEFRTRFPGLKQWASENNLTLTDAITGFLEYEAGMKSLESQYSGTSGDQGAVTPGEVSALMQKGYSITEVQEAYKVGKRLKDNEAALTAFNSVLVANGMPALSGTDMVDFLQGNAPAEIYEIYEAASFQEGAQAAGIGDYFSAEDAYAAAQYTEGSVTLDSALQGMNQAASTLLRFRHELDMSKYGLDHEDLVDVSLGLPPRSGATAADIMEGMNRAQSEAAATRGQFQARPFTTFTGDGRMGSMGVTSGRAEY